MDSLPFFPPAASANAGEVDLLTLTLVGLGGFFSLVVLAFIIYFGIRYRRGNQVDRSNPPLTNLKIELGWVFGLLFLGISTYVWAATIYYRLTQPPQQSMEIYVLGQQWMWIIQHPQGHREINALHVPAGEDVRLIMTSEDVIHSFYIPAFRIKYDVLPGRYTSLWFKATQPGEYHIFCAEYCGALHSGMIGTVYVMEPRQYQEWLSGSGPQTGRAGAAQVGEQLFQQLGCSSCHAQAANVRAPQLDGLFGLPVPLADGSTVTVDENYIRESILFPQEKIVAGYEPIMPSYEARITETQMIALVAYIKSLGGSTSPGTDQPPGDSQFPSQTAPPVTPERTATP